MLIMVSQDPRSTSNDPWAIPTIAIGMQSERVRAAACVSCARAGAPQENEVSHPNVFENDFIFLNKQNCIVTIYLKVIKNHT